MKHILISVLSVLSLQTWSKEDALYVSLNDLLEETRDPLYSSEQRKHILEFSRKLMALKLAEDMGVKSSELQLTFVTNPTRASELLQDPWYDVQTQFYTTLHQENFYTRWEELQKLVKFSPYGKGIAETMLGHLGNYSPVIEGRYYARWSKLPLKTGNKTRHFNVPYFLMSENVQELIETEAHVPFEEIFSAKELPLFISKTENLTRVKRQELAEKMELNKRIYLRAVANAAKTIASIHYLTGVVNKTQTENKVGNFLDTHCKSCTKNDKQEFQTAAMIYVDNIKKTMTIGTAGNIATNFCSSLKENHYYWNVDRLKPTPVEVLADQTKLVNYYTIHKLKKKNHEAIAKTILDQDLGVLFLTSAINVLDKYQEPVGTKLNCTSTSLSDDAKLVLAAIDEAQLNVESYVERINTQLSSSVFDLKATNSTLEYFVQTNQSATIEAASAFPQGIGWVLKSVAELDQNVSRRKRTDKVISWGGTIIGLGLTISGAAAPEGVAILLASANTLKGLASGSYFFVRATEEKKFAKELRLAKNGSAVLNDENFKKQYEEYHHLKISYIKEFAGSALTFVSLHKLALKHSGGNVNKAHSVLHKVFEVAKETGEEHGVLEIQNLIIEHSVH